MTDPVPTIPDMPVETIAGASVKEKIPGRQDKYLWAIYIALIFFSLIELYSASSREVTAGHIFFPLIRHAVLLGIGTVIVFTLSRIKFRRFYDFIPLFVLGSILLMVYVLFKGDIVNGARRSVTVMGFSLYPSEFLKLSAVLVIALLMSKTHLKKKHNPNSCVIATAGVVLFMGGLLFSQGLTNTILLMAISFSMMIVGGIKWTKLFIVLVCYGLAAGAGYAYKEFSAQKREVATTVDESIEKQEPISRNETWKVRLMRWSFFDDTPKYTQAVTSKNQQEMYSYMAQANGGIFGQMPGNSREASRLPLAFSDYIYAIIIEDLGLVGGVAVLLLYLSLIARAGSIAARCSSALPAMLVMGCAVMIILQALFHMAIVTGVFPVSGQPLPLISKGGTSIIITSIAFGIMLSISRFAVQSGKRQEAKEESNSLPEEFRAANPTQLT